MPTKFVTNPRRPAAKRNPLDPKVKAIAVLEGDLGHEVHITYSSAAQARRGKDDSPLRGYWLQADKVLFSEPLSAHEAVRMAKQAARDVEYPEDRIKHPRRRNPPSKRKEHRVGQYAVIEEHDGRLFFGRYERNGEFVISPADKSRVLATEAGRKKAIATYFARVGAKANPRRKNPPKGFRIAGPAVKTMSERLRISKADAQRLKDMMDTGAPRILQAADRMMNGHGVERISGVGGGLMYVNMGDTYDTTLIYDYKTNRFVVSSWGDIVERQPRRFAD